MQFYESLMHVKIKAQLATDQLTIVQYVNMKAIAHVWVVASSCVLL